MNEANDLCTYSDLIVRASAFSFSKRPALIAIGGFGGAGKSTLARKVQSDVAGAEVSRHGEIAVLTENKVSPVPLEVAGNPVNWEQ